MEFPHWVLAAGRPRRVLGFVDDVVVDEGGGVDDFDDCAEFDGPAAFVVEELGGEQKQCWAQAFAAATAEVFTDLGDGGDAGDGVAAELALDGGKVVAEELEDLAAVG